MPVLKWPNDVLAGDAKLGGILAERTGTAVVVGIGINVWQGAGGPARRTRPPPPWRWRPRRVAPAGPDGGPGLRERLLTDLLDGLVALVPGLAGPGQPGGRGRVRAAPGVRCAGAPRWAAR